MAIEKLEDYKPAARVNPFVAELEGLAEGDAFAVILTPNERTNKQSGEVTRSIAGQKSQIQDAANAHGLTARESEREEDREDGNVRVVFVLTKRQESGPRKPAEGDAEAVEKTTKRK